MRKILLLLVVLAIALGACSSSNMNASSTKPRVNPRTPGVTQTTDEEPAPEIPVFKMSAADTPRWDAVRSEVGGLPVPRGWKQIERKLSGYLLSETYQAPSGVTYDQVLAWYLKWFPEGKPWGGWTYCSRLAGSGDAQLYQDIPENWAWRNPMNDHLIQIGLGGASDGSAGGTMVSLFRSEFGEHCME